MLGPTLRRNARGLTGGAAAHARQADGAATVALSGLGAKEVCGALAALSIGPGNDRGTDFNQGQVSAKHGRLTAAQNLHSLTRGRGRFVSLRSRRPRQPFTRGLSSVRPAAVPSCRGRPAPMLHLGHDASELHGVASLARDRWGSRGRRCPERITGAADRGIALRRCMPSGRVLADELAIDTPPRSGRTHAAAPPAWMMTALPGTLGRLSRPVQTRTVTSCRTPPVGLKNTPRCVLPPRAPTAQPALCLHCALGWRSLARCQSTCARSGTAFDRTTRPQSVQRSRPSVAAGMNPHHCRMLTHQRAASSCCTDEWSQPH